jgi:hypothetical protein
MFKDELLILEIVPDSKEDNLLKELWESFININDLSNIWIQYRKDEQPN